MPLGRHSHHISDELLSSISIRCRQDDSEASIRVPAHFVSEARTSSYHMSEASQGEITFGEVRHLEEYPAKWITRSIGPQPFELETCQEVFLGVNAMEGSRRIMRYWYRNILAS
jgi:hypothetical protein